MPLPISDTDLQENICDYCWSCLYLIQELITVNCFWFRDSLIHGYIHIKKMENNKRLLKSWKFSFWILPMEGKLKPRQHLEKLCRCLSKSMLSLDLWTFWKSIFSETQQPKLKSTCFQMMWMYCGIKQSVKGRTCLLKEVQMKLSIIKLCQTRLAEHVHIVALRFTFCASKLHINSLMMKSERKPVIGMKILPWRSGRTV